MKMNGFTQNIHGNNSYINNKSLKRLMKSVFHLLIVTIFLIPPLPIQASERISEDSTADRNTMKTVNPKSGELHAFYPSNAVFSDQMKMYIDELDSISFAWSRIDAKDSASLNTVKGKNGNFGFYYPKDYLKPLEYAKSQGKSIQLNVYMDGADATKLLPYAKEQQAMIQSIVSTMETNITEGIGLTYDGVVIDFEGLRDTDNHNVPILYDGNQISTYYSQFLKELKEQLDLIDKKLYVAVNPLLYFDGYNYADILHIADRVILMAHDYEPTKKLQKNQIEQYTGYNALEPISSLAPIQMVRKALNDIKSAASDSSQLSKVWLQITFDAAQWQFDAKSAKNWEELSDTTLSRAGRLTPLYQSIKARVDNNDGYGENITCGYNNELQSPYIQYYNSSDRSWNVILYEDSTSINAKIELAKDYQLGGISLWSLANIPDYNDKTGKKFHLNGWSTIISKMNSYDTLSPDSNKYISFTDTKVEQAVREKLGKDTGNISVKELLSIYRLKLPQGVKSLKDITAIENLTKLRVLYLQRNSISDISALKKLSKLEVLSLNGNQIVSITPLSTLTNLHELYIRENKISNIEALNKLTKLELLEGGKNSIQNIENLKNLKNLKSLSLDDNQINNITGLKALTNLKNLDLSNNKITTINALQNISGLETLYLQRNNISNISALSALKKLRVLSMNGNEIADLKPLAKLTLLEKLYLKDNKIKNIASLKGLVKLNELYLKGNSISNYGPVNTVYSKNQFLCDFKINKGD